MGEQKVLPLCYVWHVMLNWSTARAATVPVLPVATMVAAAGPVSDAFAVAAVTVTLDCRCRCSRWCVYTIDADDRVTVAEY